MTFMNSRAQRQRRKQSGFSLIELMVAIAIISVLAGLIATQFSGDSSKATKLYADMSTVRDSVNRAKMELGGVPNRLSVLWNQPEAIATNMFNGITATRTWNGPYLERQGTDDANKVIFPTIADAATLEIAREAATAANGGSYVGGWIYFLRASNIPRPIIIELMKKCAGVDITRLEGAPSPSFANSACRTSVADAEIGTVDMKITDSR